MRTGAAKSLCAPSSVDFTVYHRVRANGGSGTVAVVPPGTDAATAIHGPFGAGPT